MNDKRTREHVREALDNDHNIPAEVEVEVDDGEVILKGTVDNQNLKRMTEDAVAQLPENADIDNQLRVGNSRQRGNPPVNDGVSTNETKHRA